MSELLNADFVAHHISAIPWSLISEAWELEHHGPYYQLDLKMCQIRTLNYSFIWDDESMPTPRIFSAVETPSKIVRLDVSLNELVSLSHDGLSPLTELRVLDASLNQLKHVQGIEVLHHLYSLNLSHNSIKTVSGLLNCHYLKELNLSNNLIEDISNIPSLISLRVLNINNNKVQSLTGVSSFPKLEEIYVNNNELNDLLPLTVCPHLHVLSAARNQIKSFDVVVRLINQLKHLRSLNLSGNPVERNRTYKSDILKACNIVTLDNVSVAPMPSDMDDDKHHAGNMYTLRDAAREAFNDRMRVAKGKMEENVYFLQRRIISIQNEYAEFEQKLKSDLKACMLYFDSLSETELTGRGRHNMRVSRFRAHDQVYNPGQSLTSSSRSRGQGDRGHYKNIRETDEILRCTFNELIKQRDGLNTDL